MPNLPKTSADGARENAAANGFKIVYDKSYPPPTTDFGPTVRAIQAANADIVFVAAYPPDTVGIVRAAHEIGLTPKMFGGTMIGLLITPIKAQLGAILDGLVIMESFVPAPTFEFPGLADVLKRYRAVAAGEKLDPFGYGFVPFGYAAGQILAQAVEATVAWIKMRSQLHAQSQFQTVAGKSLSARTANGRSRRARSSPGFQNVAPNGTSNDSRPRQTADPFWPPKSRPARSSIRTRARRNSRSPHTNPVRGLSAAPE